jgi:hypothetical protein
MMVVRGGNIKNPSGSGSGSHTEQVWWKQT